MSFPRQVQFNPNEQFVSTDLNALQGYIGQELSDFIARLLAFNYGAGQASPGPLAGLGVIGSGNAGGGVLTGLDVGVPSSGNGPVVNPGLGFVINSTPPSLGTGEAGTQSALRWIRTDVQQTLGAITIPGSGVNVYLVEAKDMTVNNPSGGTSRNVWVVTSSSVQAQTLTKEIDPASTAASGAIKFSSTSPGTSLTALPALDSGYIPLAVIVVPSGASGLAASQIYDVRRKYFPKGGHFHGLLSGFVLQWTSANTLQLSLGEAFVQGQPLLNPVDRAYTSSTWRMQSGVTSPGNVGAANTVFYCYAVVNGTANDGTITPAVPESDPSVVIFGGMITYGGFALVLSTTAPNRNGQPSANITVGATTTAPQFTATPQNAIFVGSICADASGNIIPFTRLGNDVIFVCGRSTLGAAAQVFTGASANSYAVAFSGGFAVLPATASAAILDAQLSSSDTASNVVYFLDPVANGNTLPGGSFSATTTPTSAEIGVATSPTGGTTLALSDTRVRTRLDSTGKVWMGFSGMGGTPADSMTASCRFRGYVESAPYLTF